MVKPASPVNRITTNTRTNLNGILRGDGLNIGIVSIGSGLSFNGTTLTCTVAATSPGGSNGQLQYNNASAFDGAEFSAVATSGTLLTLTAQANADNPLKVSGTGASQSGDLIQWSATTGTGKVNSRGAVLTPGASATLDGQNIDLGCLGYLGVGTLRVTGSDGSNNHFVQTATSGNIGFAINENSAANGFYLQTNNARRLATFVWNADFDHPEFQLWARPSGGSNPGRQICSLAGVWGAVDASRTGRITINVLDYNDIRECIRFEADGTEALLGFYGVSAISRKVLATGAGHTVDDVITALQNLGLVKQS